MDNYSQLQFVSILAQESEKISGDIEFKSWNTQTVSRIEAEISPWTDEMTMNVVTIGFPKEKLEETFKMTENKLENHSRIASLCNLNRFNKRLSVPKRIIIRSKTNEKISLDKHLKERRTHVIDDNSQEYPSMLVTNDSLSGESSHHAQISQQISNFNRNSRLSNTHKPLKLPRVASDKQLTRISVGESTTRINKRDKTPWISDLLRILSREGRISKTNTNKDETTQISQLKSDLISSTKPSTPQKRLIIYKENPKETTKTVTLYRNTMVLNLNKDPLPVLKEPKSFKSRIN